MTLSPRNPPPSPCSYCYAVGRHLDTCARPEVTGVTPAEGKWTCLGCNAVQHGPSVLVDGKKRCLGCGCHAAIRAVS